MFIYGAGAAPQSVVLSSAQLLGGQLGPCRRCSMYRQAARAPVGPPLAGSGQTLVVTVTHTYKTYSDWPLFGRDPGGTPALLLRGRLLAQVPVQAMGWRAPLLPGREAILRKPNLSTDGRFFSYKYSTINLLLDTSSSLARPSPTTTFLLPLFFSAALHLQLR